MTCSCWSLCLPRWFICAAHDAHTRPHMSRLTSDVFMNSLGQLQRTLTSASLLDVRTQTVGSETDTGHCTKTQWQIKPEGFYLQLIFNPTDGPAYAGELGHLCFCPHDKTMLHSAPAARTQRCSAHVRSRRSFLRDLPIHKHLLSLMTFSSCHCEK